MSDDILDPYEKLIKTKYNTSSERKNLIIMFIKDIGLYNEKEEQLIYLDKEIGNLIKIFCKNCVNVKKHLNLNWGQMIDKFNYCCTEQCLLNNLIQTNKTVKQFNELSFVLIITVPCLIGMIIVFCCCSRTFIDRYFTFLI